MERLTAFEFIPATDDPQPMRIMRNGICLGHFNVLMWLGWIPSDPIFFDQTTDLAIEGLGIGRPYWNDDVPPWMNSFDPKAEKKRIDMIRHAAQKMAQAQRPKMSDTMKEVVPS